MTTANQITDGAYRICGIYSPSTEQDTNALLALNQMIGLWGASGLMIPFETRETFTLVAGTDSYTIGSGATFNTVRPLSIESAYLQDSDSIDHPLDVTLSYEEYSEERDKSVQVLPTRLFYDPQYANGKIYFSGNPNAAYTLYLSSRKPLTEFALIGDTVNLPPEYAKALRFSLAVDIAPEINVTLDQIIINMATGAHLDIRDLNAKEVPWMEFDRALTHAVWR